jgi:hypothetical protein
MKKGLSLILVLLILSLTFSSTYAQSLHFKVDHQEVSLFINQDGTASIDYTISFINDSGGAKIDYVDIGMPPTSFDLSSVTAELDGKPVKDIQKSDVLKGGIAFGLGTSTIQPGKSGTLHVLVGKVNKLLFFATEKESEKYASFQFSPNYFGSSYVSGKTDMTVTLYMPPGLQTTEPRYFPPTGWPGDSTPTSNYDSQGRVYFRWQSANANAFTEYRFGGAFPARLVPAGAITTQPLVNFDPTWLCCFGVGGISLFFIGFAFYQSIWGAKKRKLAYLPPKVSIEGHGIKRGLTAVEAAILMEEPMDKILTMILFAAIKKAAARVLVREPLKIEITNPIPEGLQTYELDFLKAMQLATPPEQRKLLQDMMIALVKGVSEKMRGFSRKETIAYYQEIIKKAWEQVETADTPDVKMQKYDETMDWTMLDHKFEDRTRQVFVPGNIWIMPTWWGRYDPTFHAPSAPVSSMGGSPISLPQLPGSTFAASVINGVQSWSAGVIGNVTNFTSGVTNKTNPVPVSTSSGSSGGRSGGGCACACACAGCACACAGGGR